MIFIKASSAPVVKLEGGKIIFEFGFSVDLLASSNCSACTITGVSVPEPTLVNVCMALCTFILLCTCAY